MPIFPFRFRIRSKSRFRYDVTALKKEKEILKMEKEHLERRVDELERCRNISVEKYDRMKILEETVENLKNDLRRQEDEYKMEKTQRIKAQDTIKDFYVMAAVYLQSSGSYF